MTDIQTNPQTVPAAGATQPNLAINQRPEGLPDKFNSWTDLAQAYGELEKKLGGGGQQDQPTDQAPQADPIDFTRYFAEYAQNGTLSRQSYTELSGRGLTQDFVDQYIEGQSVLVDAHARQVKEITGGDQGYSQMVNWAKTNLSPQDIEAYNRGVNGTLHQAKLTVQGLWARYQASNGTPGSVFLQGTGGGSAQVTGGFSNRTEQDKAINDPRYRNDEGYRNEVIRRIALSRF